MDDASKRTRPSTRSACALQRAPCPRVPKSGTARGPRPGAFCGCGTSSEQSLELSVRNGKILRVEPDGSAPPDNPFYDGSGTNADDVFVLGVKNAFGLAFHPHTGELWGTDNGSGAQDEVNLMRRGTNLGWPYVQGFCDDVRDNPYTQDETDYCAANGVVEPVHEVSPSIAPTGLVIVAEDSAYPVAHHNSVWYLEYVSGLLNQILLVGELDTNGGVSTIASIPGGLDIVQAPDGYIYVSPCAGSQETCDGRIYRVD